MSIDKSIKFNTKAHNKIFKKYNIKHTEIYNNFEQKRLKEVIKRITEYFKINKGSKILDFGSGTGNLTRKFLEYKCKVIASDVSERSLFYLKKLANDDSNLEVDVYNGSKLSFKENTFDGVATYSVLHHVPNYLEAVNEMIRVTKPGGFIYIDHEANKERWNPDENLSQYNLLTKQTLWEHFLKLLKTKELFSFEFIKAVFIISLINKRYRREGDIHVWKDDHIEWDKIKEIFKKNGCKIVEEADYLMYKPKGGMKSFDKYKKKCSDTKYVIFKK